MSKADLYFDGLCDPNPGGTMCYGFVLIDRESGEVMHEGSGRVKGEPSTNNMAEYSALVYGLRKAKEMGVRDIACYGDSDLVVKQIKGTWAAKADHLKRAVEAVKREGESFDERAIEWIPREKNEHADRLSVAAFTKITGKAPTDYSKFGSKPRGNFASGRR